MGLHCAAMWRLCLLLVGGWWACGLAAAAEVRVAVAASFAAPLAALAEGFERDSGHRLRITAGATGKFYAQIKAGAPFDVLLAADQDTPAKLISDGLALANSRITYATGRLVLWSQQAALVDDSGAVLGTNKFKHLAIANPKVAPYGRAAVQVMQARGEAAALAPRLVLGESVAQAYQFVFTGNAELGFVALSQVHGPDKPASGSWWLVPLELHAPIAQDAVLLRQAAKPAAAQALLNYLRRPEAMQVLRQFGYE
jgi:molybdate transport system substrate-binding protein